MDGLHEIFAQEVITPT